MIEINKLSFGYRKKEKLFHELSLNLTPGRIYGLLGKNGAGKTTLLKIMCGLLFPQNGECKIFKYQSDKRLPEMLKEIFFLPEEFYLPPITPREFVNAYSPFYDKFNKNQLYEYISNFDIPANSKLTSISYGQKKKFILSFGLATNCKILLLDEPTNGLDIPSKSQFRKTIASAITDDKIIIISTHQVRDTENLIDSIIILDDGKIIFKQDMDTILKKLTVKLTSDLKSDKDIIHYEKTIGGFAILLPNKGDQDAKIDLEILFNAIINNKEKFHQLFHEEATIYENQ
ncbi:MAG: ABC transporter ATP-binding protein [Candidatus Marinimicrobia bacterium]|nr:ABC transporter ATP-binding protein [Candidatus Neomarinimicrobiota bacterium]